MIDHVITRHCHQRGRETHSRSIKEGVVRLAYGRTSLDDRLFLYFRALRIEISEASESAPDGPVPSLAQALTAEAAMAHKESWPRFHFTHKNRTAWLGLPLRSETVVASCAGLLGFARQFCYFSGRE
ncbi:MAG: hypothetical protein ABW061_05635 [Polyangiaceae bacterium]